MKVFKGLPSLSVNILCLVLLILQSIYMISIYGFSHINMNVMLNTIFAICIFIGCIIGTILILALVLSFYIFKKIDLVEGKFENIFNLLRKNLSNLKKDDNLP